MDVGNDFVRKKKATQWDSFSDLDVSVHFDISGEKEQFRTTIKHGVQLIIVNKEII